MAGIEALVVYFVYFLIVGIGTYFGIHYSAEYFRRFGIVRTDGNKEKERKVPSGVGIVLALSFVFSVILFVLVNRFVPLVEIKGLEILTILSILLTSLSVAVFGFIDDIGVSNRKRKAEAGHEDYHVGISQKSTALLSFLFCTPILFLPLYTYLDIPLVGRMHLGMIFPLLAVVGVWCASNGVNLLGGYDGLNSGIVTVMYLGLMFVFYILGNHLLMLLTVIAFLILIIFHQENLYPSKVIGGDSYTFFAGGLFASLVIAGKVEFIGFLLFLPFAVESVLHALKGFKVSCLAPHRDGKFYVEKVETLPHLFIKLGANTEKQLALSFMLVEMVIVVVVYFLMVGGRL